MTTELVPTIINLPAVFGELMQRVQHTERDMLQSTRIRQMAAATPRGDTDASEHNWRVVQYQAAKTLLAMASDIINRAVEGGTPSDQFDPSVFLMLAVALSRGGGRRYQD